MHSFPHSFLFALFNPVAKQAFLGGKNYYRAFPSLLPSVLRLLVSESPKKVRCENVVDGEPYLLMRNLYGMIVK